jgi:hypothetical protein
MEKPLLALFVIVVLLLVVMPGLLYLLAWGAARFTQKSPTWLGFPRAETRVVRGAPPRRRDGASTPRQ